MCPKQDEPIKLPAEFEETLAALLAVPKPSDEDSDDSDDDDQATADSPGSE